MTSSLADLIGPPGIDTMAQFINGEIQDLFTQITGDTQIPGLSPGAINSRMQNAITNLLRNASASGSASAGLDFSGLGAQAFQEATHVHLTVTGHFTDMLQAVYNAMEAFTSEVFGANDQYDGTFAMIQETDYAPAYYSEDPIARGAYTAFVDLNPKNAMITDVITSTAGDEVMRNGSEVLTSPLLNAYERLNMRVEREGVSIPTGPSGKPATADAQWQAQCLVLSAFENLYTDLNRVYTGWGNAIEKAFVTLTSAMSSTEQQIQPYIDLLTNPSSAASIYAMIGSIAQSDEPIAIVQTGPDSIMVFISGTNGSKIGYDTNVYNALMTGLGQDSPYEQDVIEAIRKFCQEHGLTDPSVTLAGHSMGGMIAQQLASRVWPDFSVSEVITFGSPVMGPPNLGVEYHMYEADGDIVPLFSRYENPSLPASYQDLAANFPKVTGGNFLDTIDTNARGLGYVLGEVEAMSPYLTPQTQQMMQQAITQYTGNSLADLVPDFKLRPSLPPEAKITYMDPQHLYNNATETGIQRVPDLTNPLPSVHSQYGQSQWLEQQKIVFPDTSNLNVPGNVEYFGFDPAHLQQTAQITQYMKDTSNLSLLVQLFAH